MSKLFELKEWLTLEGAAKHLSVVFKEEVTQADVLRFAREKLLRLSVYFPESVKVKQGEILRRARAEIEACLAANNLPTGLEWQLLPPDDAISLPNLPAEAEGEPVLVIRSLKIDADHYVKFSGKVTAVNGVWDLPMIGGEQLDIENKFQQLTNGHALASAALEGVTLQGADGALYQLQDQLTVTEYSNFWNAQHRELKQYIIDGDIEKAEGEALIDQHKEERKQLLKKIKALSTPESYHPATRLPNNCILVVRRDALREFERAVKSDQFGANSPAELGQHSIPTSSCQPATAAKIILYFRVKPDTDQNDAWWKEKMRGASRNGLEECRIGQGIKGRTGTLWRPDLVAAWLVDRNQRGREGMNEKAAAAALRKFPGCEEAADNFFSSNE